MNIKTFFDLLNYFPYRYVDRSEFRKVSQLSAGDSAVQLKGVINHFQLEGKGAKQRLKATFRDDSGSCELIWFKGIRWVREQIIAGKEYIIFGKAAIYNNTFSFAHPEVEALKPQNLAQPRMQPVYSTGEKLARRGLNSKGFETILKSLVNSPNFHLPENLPQRICQELKLISRADAFRFIHQPQTALQLRHARRRLKFEELFYLQLDLLYQKHARNEAFRGYTFQGVGDYFNRFYTDHLPFELTNAQKKVLREIHADMRTGNQMNRLLQGDVGSGKTLVALLAGLIAIDNGFQVAIMAPTEILAQQHFETLQAFLKNMPVSVALLTSSTKTAERKLLHARLRDGSIHFLIGTHAILEPVVKFKNLGLAIIDEQHRFGVAQRARLWKKNAKPPHILVMTATPIPRTLAMTMYGDLDVSVIDELPPGRKEIKTAHYNDSARSKVFGFMEKQIALGRQVYVVYPLIEESAALDLKDLMDGYESIVRRFPQPQYQISIVHGRMKPEDKEFEMARFAKGETNIMVATTVIEVGVNVPNASVMVIESAQRFGLSQLHQLRGRVGRGADQSYCLLLTDAKLSREAQVRMKTMTETNDGFKISEVDLNLRGPGDITGLRQSGMIELKIADLQTDSKILHFARQKAIELLAADPKLASSENQMVSEYYHRLKSGQMEWSKIS